MYTSPLILKVDDALELRLHTLNDAEREWQLLSENLDYLSKWVDWAQPTYTKDDMRRDMADNMPKYEAGEMYAMGVYLDGKLVGNVDVRDIIDGESAEVGYLLAEAYTGRGIVTKSMQTLMDYTQKQHTIRTFYLNTYTDNAASKKVAERLGFSLVDEKPAENGRLESHYKKDMFIQ